MRNVRSKNKPSSALPRKAPDIHTLNLFVTERCNLNCRYCFISKEKTKGNPDLQERDLKRILHAFFSVSKSSSRKIGFMGGEPTLRFDMVKKTIKLANSSSKKRKKMEFGLTTNGTMIDHEMLAFLLKNKIITTISLDGDKTTQDRNRLSSAFSTFEMVDRVISRIDLYKLRIGASMVITPNNLDDFLENMEFLKNKGFYIIDFYPDLFVRWNRDEIEKFKANLEKFRERYADLFCDKDNKRIFKNSFLDAVANDESLEKMDHCGKMNADVSGNFYICDKVFSLKRKERSRYKIGDMKKGLDIKMRNNLLLNLKKGFLKSSGLNCPKCPSYNFCFCPLGHHIYYLASRQQTREKPFWKSFCRLSREYVKTFVEIKRELGNDSRFLELYRR